MLNRRQKGVILLAVSLLGYVYTMLTDSGSFESPFQLLVFTYFLWLRISDVKNVWKLRLSKRFLVIT